MLRKPNVTLKDVELFSTKTCGEIILKKIKQNIWFIYFFLELAHCYNYNVNISMHSYNKFIL